MRPETVARVALAFSASRAVEQKARRATFAARTAGRRMERALLALTTGRPTAHHVRRAQLLAAVQDILRWPAEQAHDIAAAQGSTSPPSNVEAPPLEL